MSVNRYPSKVIGPVLVNRYPSIVIGPVSVNRYPSKVIRPVSVHKIPHKVTRPMSVDRYHPSKVIGSLSIRHALRPFATRQKRGWVCNL